MNGLNLRNHSRCVDTNSTQVHNDVFLVCEVLAKHRKKLEKKLEVIHIGGASTTAKFTEISVLDKFNDNGKRINPRPCIDPSA